MATKIQLRRDTAANWEASNPILSQGEMAYVLDSGRIKIGDGVTTWKNLPLEGDALKITSDNSHFGYHTVSGVKEFTFTTRGHRWTELVATATTTDGTFTVDANVYPDIANVYELWDIGNSVSLWFNGNYTSTYYINNIDISGNIYSITMNNDPTITTGDRITIMAWTQGTRATWDSVYQSDDWRAYQPTSNSNVVQVEIGYNTTLRDKLLANPTKSSIIFDDKPVNWYNNSSQKLVDDARSIKSVTLVSANIYEIAFDGPPTTIKTDDASFAITANASVTTTGLNYVAISKTLYPELAEYAYYSGGQITVNAETINISGIPDPYQSTYEYPNIGYIGDNWVIYLASNVTTCNSGDEITITWQKPGTEISFVAHDPGHSQGGNFIQWFDWRKDLPFFKASRTNGVTSGRIDWTVKIARPDDNTVDYQNSFKPSQDFGYDNPGNYIGGPTTVYFDQWDYNYDRWFGESHNNQQNSNLFWWYGPEGIFFKEYSYGNRSQDIKVKVAYKMDLFISDDDHYWD